MNHQLTNLSDGVEVLNRMDSVRTNFLAMTGDKQYVYPVGVAMYSLSRHVLEPLHLDYAIPRDWSLMISRAELGMIESLALSLGWSFEIVEVPLAAADLPRTRHISSMTFMKPAYFDVSQRPQVAFLDGDLIAVDDWSALLKPISNSFALAAAREDNMGTFERIWAPNRQPGWYFNAGVLQARPQVWRQRYKERWRMLLEEFDQHGFSLLEQDIMNAALLGDVGYLAPELNYRPAYSDNSLGASIVHFAGWWKPWLTVPTELHQLPTQMRSAYELFISAEKGFLRHITMHLREESAAKWRREKSKLRGVLGWRAYRRYIRWSMAQRIRNSRDLFRKSK